MKFGVTRQYFSDSPLSECPEISEDHKDYIKRDIYFDISRKLIEELLKFPNNHASIKLEITDTIDDYWESMERHHKQQPQEYRIDGEITEVVYHVQEPRDFLSAETVIRVSKLNKFQKLIVRVFRMKKEIW